VIDNSQPPNVTPDKKPSNLKPEFQANNMKDDAVSPDNDPQNAAAKDSANEDKGKTSTRTAGEIGTESNEKEISNISALYTTDKQILDLLSQNLIKNTQIAPVDALIPDPDINREKGVQWIPPKVSSITGKKGSVTLMWLVDPQGNVETRFVKSSGVKELDDIARETAKEYKFQPLEGAESGKYRLVTAKYDFP
jgi:TonB family protein